MPRPKVPLSQRQRAVQACRLCKSSKKKCNAQIPCSNCVRRGRGDSCEFPDEREGTSDASVRAMLPSPHSIGGLDGGGEGEDGDGEVRRRAGLKRKSAHVEPQSEKRRATGEAMHKTRPRLLDNARGEKVYVGGSAAISFLQLVRDTVAQCIGRSDFSDDATRDRMLEAEAQVDEGVGEETALSVPQQYAYVDLYMVATSGVIRILSNEETLQAVFASRDSPHRLRYALGRVVLAIGAQCAGKHADHARREKRFFAEAQRMAFAGMLQDPSLEIARLFLLMAFYVIGACRRNTGFMYLGIAARAAIALGLHNFETFRTLSEGERDIRKRTWESIVTLDHMVSSILGRPSATCLDRTSPEDRGGKSRASSSSDGAEEGYDTSFTAVYQLSIRIDGIVSKLYGRRVATVESAQVELRSLREWSESLPDELRYPPISQCVEKEAQKRVIGCLHVSCFYYFAVMLVTRPFVIGYLTKRLAAAQAPTGQPASSHDASSANAAGDSQIVEVAQACLRAAMNMAQLCSEVQMAGFMFENMRILKAWIFGAALVLGFQMFAISELDEELEEAFQTAHAVLKKLSNQSVQAAYYYDIITYLSNAITKRRQMQSSMKRRGNDLVVDKIMSLRPTTARADEWTAVVSDPANKALMDAQDRWLENLQLEAQGFFPLLDDGSLGWENAGLQFWDQFPVDHQSLESMDMPMVPM